jgi:transposase
LEQGLSAQRIYQDLVAEHGFEGKYPSVRRYVARQCQTRAKPFRRMESLPGEEAQIDFGTAALVQGSDGTRRRPWAFRVVLSHSRKGYTEAVWRQSTEAFIGALENAFAHFGGVPKTLVIDNLKAAVKRGDWYDPEIHPKLQSFARHYGTVFLPTRPYTPRHKGKVEAGVKYVKGNALKGRQFESLEAQNAFLCDWEARIADTRIHGTTKRQVAAMFAEERPSLRPLPVEPFRYYRHGTRTVHLDGAVEVEGAYYHLPPGWLGRRVAVQWDVLQLRILDPATGALVREHVRQRRGHRRLRDEDRPQRTPATTLTLLARAQRVGKSAGALCEHLHRHEGEAAVRRILGVLALSKKHGPLATEAACTAALELGAPSYGFVKRYLTRRLVTAPALTQIDPLIRQLTLYREEIDRLTTPKEGDPL